MPIYALAFVAHIVGAMTLLIGLVLIMISLWRLPRAASVAQGQRWAGRATKADKLLPTGAALILLSGVYLTLTRWGWSHGWVNTSLAALLLVSPLAPCIIAPRLSEIRKVAAGTPTGPLPSALQIASNDLTLHASVSVMMAVAVGIGVVMVMKPTTLGSLMIVAIALLVGLAAAFPAWRWRRTAS